MAYAWELQGQKPRGQKRLSPPVLHTVTLWMERRHPSLQGHVDSDQLSSTPPDGEGGKVCDSLKVPSTGAVSGVPGYSNRGRLPGFGGCLFHGAGGLVAKMLCVSQRAPSRVSHGHAGRSNQDYKNKPVSRNFVFPPRELVTDTSQRLATHLFSLALPGGVGGRLEAAAHSAWGS